MKNKAWLVFSVAFLAAVTSGSAEVSDMLSLSNLAIPPSLGKMESRFDGQSERRVIHIQDVHAHLPAQENIAALVEHLHTYYGINIFAIEGGWSASSFPKSWALPPSRGKQMLARALLEEDYITGPIHAALFSTTPITVVGIEDKKIYEQNRQIYIQHLSQREAILEKNKTLNSKIEQAKTSVFNPDLLTFDHTLTEFRDGKNADKFIPSLLTQAGAREIDLGDLNQISIFKKVLEMEKTIDKKKLESEAGRLMNEFKRKGMHFEELLKSGEIPPEKLEFYPNAQKYLEIMHAQDEINHSRFFSEIETAIGRMKEKLVLSDEEKVLDQRSSALIPAKKISLLQATPSDLKTFEETKQNADPDVQEAGLSEALALGLHFYELVKKRDQIFFERIANHPKLRGNIAVVTGGFHTEGMSARFEEAGISYMVITPDLANEAPDEHLYFERLKENAPEAQTLSALNNLPFRAGFDPGFSRIARLPMDNLKKAVSGVLTYQVGKPAQTPNLVQSGQVVELKNLSPENRQIEIQKGWDLAKNSTSPDWLFIRASRLKEILDQGEIAQAVLKSVFQNRNHHLFILYTSVDEILDLKIETGANIRLLKKDDFDSAISLDQFQKARALNAIAIIDPEYQGKVGVVLRKVRPASLLLWSLLLQKAWPYSTEDAEMLSVIEQFFGDLQTRGLLETAA